MSAHTEEAFFVAGGTVPPGSPSYVERAADRELVAALLTGEFAYVLNSRQMGKSSLAVRTIARLEAAGVRSAFVDLTRLGGATVSPEQWYAGLLVETGRALGLRAEAAAYLRESRDLGPAQRLLGFLSEVALARIAEPVVVMLDEIDAVRSLPFSTDELFAGIRQLHNGRASEPALRRLTFCLLGAALPSDLIRDPRTTPFNVGRRIELRDFTPEEARPFASQIGEEALVRVLHWTGGHPFLTQSLCAELSGSALPSGGEGMGVRGNVDALVRARYLDARARQTDTNLADVGRRLLGEGDPEVDDLGRAATLSLLARMERGDIADDEANPSAARVKMSGVSRLQDGRLLIRNRIYGRVFGKAWIRENMPGEEQRRQRAAFWRGALRAAGLATLVVFVVGFLAVRNLGLALENSRQRDAARYLAYTASMQTLSIDQGFHDVATMAEVLNEFKDSPYRGWEYGYWWRIAHPDAWSISLSPGVDRVVPPTREGRRVAVLRSDALLIVDTGTGRTIRRFPPPVPNDRTAFVWWMRDDRRLLVRGADGSFTIMDAETGDVRRLGRPASPTLPAYDYRVTTPGDRAFLALDANGAVVRVEIPSLKITPLPKSPGGHDLNWPRFSVDGTLVAGLAGRSVPGHTAVSIRRALDGREIRHLSLPLEVSEAVPIAGGARLLAVGDGLLCRYDVATGRELWRLRLRPEGRLQWIVPTPDERLALVSGSDGVNRLVRLSDEAGTLVREFAGGFSGFVTGDDRVAVVSGRSLHGYALDHPVDVPERRLPGRGTSEAVISPQGTLYGLDASVPMLDLTRHDSVPQPYGFTNPNDLPVGNGQNRLRVGGGRLSFLDADAHPAFSIVQGANNPSVGAASFDGRWTAMTLDPRRIGVFDLRRKRWVARLNAPQDIAQAMFSPDGDLLAAVGRTGELAVWATRDWRPFWSRATGGDVQTALEFSYDHAWLALADKGTKVEIYDARTGRLRSTLSGHANGVNAVAWSRDGRRIATASSDGAIRIWDPATGRSLGIIARYEHTMMALSFLPDGKTLAGFDDTRTVRWWLAER